jgi:hypothetical protein
VPLGAVLEPTDIAELEVCEAIRTLVGGLT